ncbi:RICIN domain-containing protein [Streptomyces sp. NPDC005574]|uniref:RICIN domain-containing protein n=1 Tax=Streptomyces sp. NPDC005574 TaxID=3156891 RepID=UPI0033A957CB
MLWVGVKGGSQTEGPGPCESHSCAITSLSGSGTDLSLSVTNRSGLDRFQYGWGLGGSSGGSTGALRGAASGRCLDVHAGSTADNARAEIWDCNGSANQSWTLNSAKELVSGRGNCLDASGAGTAAGTAVIIYGCHGGTNQQWNLNSDRTVTNVASGLCLDVTGAETVNGTLVELWNCTGGSNQQ